MYRGWRTLGSAHGNTKGMQPRRLFTARAGRDLEVQSGEDVGISHFSSATLQSNNEEGQE